MDGPETMHRHSAADVETDASAPVDERDQRLVGDPRPEPPAEPVDSTYDGRSPAEVEPPPAAEVEPAPAVVEPVTSGRVSAAAVLGLFISTIAGCAVLTGLLAPEGLAVAVVGLLFSLAGYAAAGRPGVAGRGVAGFGIVLGLAAAVVAVLAMTGAFDWPKSSTDQIASWHAWLVGHWSWLRHWS